MKKNVRKITPSSTWEDVMVFYRNSYNEMTLEGKKIIWDRILYMATCLDQLQLRFPPEHESIMNSEWGDERNARIIACAWSRLYAGSVFHVTKFEGKFRAENFVPLSFSERIEVSFKNGKIAK